MVDRMGRRRGANTGKAGTVCTDLNHHLTAPTYSESPSTGLLDHNGTYPAETRALPILLPARFA